MEEGYGKSLRVAFWNTWLLRPRLWTGGPAVPGSDRFFAPAVEARVPHVAAALAGRFDVVALAEVFDPAEIEALDEARPDATLIRGPGRSNRLRTGSGLATLVDPTRVEVLAVTRHAFTVGGDLRDSDTYATKGILHTRLRLLDRPDGAADPDGAGAGHGRGGASPTTDADPTGGDDPTGSPDPTGNDGPVGLDLFTTHLVAGGDLFPLPGATDAARHHAGRMAQVDELVDFVTASRDPALPLLLAGDLNVAAHDPDPRLEDPGDRYRDLLDHLAPLGVTDLWADQGIGPGHTCTFDDPADLPVDPDEPDRVVDDPDADPATSAGERLDYLFTADATVGDLAVVADRPRRWAFPDRPVTGGPAGSLSDHLAVSTTLCVDRR